MNTTESPAADADVVERIRAHMNDELRAGRRWVAIGDVVRMLDDGAAPAEPGALIYPITCRKCAQ